MNLDKLPPPRQLPDAQLTHAGIYVKDLDRMVDFYCRTLGLIQVDRGDMNGVGLAFLSRSENEHHQVVLAHSPQRELSGNTSLNQISFRVAGLEQLCELYRALLPAELPGMEGRHHGNSWSFYFFDPEGNKIEVYAVTPWQVRQPWRAPMDLTRPVSELEAETRAYVESLPHEPLAEWQAQMRKRLAAQ